MCFTMSIVDKSLLSAAQSTGDDRNAAAVNETLD